MIFLEPGPVGFAYSAIAHRGGANLLEEVIVLELVQQSRRGQPGRHNPWSLIKETLSICRSCRAGGLG